MTWAVHVSLAPTWFDPAETPGIGTPFMILYALHDALVKPMPGNAMAPSLAESWSVSKDGLVYEFVLRQGVKFHNGDPVTADDVKFSFERYRGAAARLLKERVAGRRGRGPAPRALPAQGAVARLHDLLRRASPPARAGSSPGSTSRRSATTASRRRRWAPAPTASSSFTPGIELVLEANEHYWRKVPSVKRLVFKAVPDETTRLAMLKRGEADIVYLLQGALAEEVQRTPGPHAQAHADRRRRTGWCSPTSGIRSRRGRTGACAWPPTTRSTARPSTRRSRSGSRGSAGASFPRASTSSGSRRPTPTIRPGPSSSSPRPAIRTASTPAISGATPPPTP